MGNEDRLKKRIAHKIYFIIIFFDVFPTTSILFDHRLEVHFRA